MVCSPLGECKERIQRVKFGNFDVVATQPVRKEREKSEEKEKKNRSKEIREENGKKTQKPLSFN